MKFGSKKVKGSQGTSTNKSLILVKKKRSYLKQFRLLKKHIMLTQGPAQFSALNMSDVQAERQQRE